MPVRLLKQSLMKWPDEAIVVAAVSNWAEQLGNNHPMLEKVGIYGSYGRGDASFGSDLDLVIIDAAAEGSQSTRFRCWPFELLPLSCDALIFTPAEYELLLQGAPKDPASKLMAQVMLCHCRWLWSRQLSS